MKSIFGRNGRSMLARFAASQAVVAFDYDGTLSPIVRDPSRAVMRAGTRRLLEEVCRRYPCAIISGRSRSDVFRFLAGVKVACVVGNHGFEWQGVHADMHLIQRRVARWARVLERRLGGVVGVSIEDKRYSLAIHYRRSHHTASAHAAIDHEVAALGSCRVIEGKHVVNVLPHGMRHKGTALARIIKECGCTAAIYVGDDITDEDAFGDANGTVLSIRVGDGESRAPYFIPDQRAIDKLLKVLTLLRPATHCKGSVMCARSPDGRS